MKKLLICCFLILFIFSCKKGEKTSAPDPEASSKDTFVKPVVDVYVDYSGSMAGYVNGKTEFKDAVYNYLTDIKISGAADALNLFYINTEPIKIEYEIKDFIDKLNPSQFLKYSSDIANIFELVLTKTENERVSILVTDGIFSPGRGKNANDYLAHQQIGIKRIMADHLEKYPDTAVVVYQLSSNFKGYYYNCNDAPQWINASRPYYIFVIGNETKVAFLNERLPEQKFKGGGIQHSYTFLPLPDNENKKMNYSILNTPRFGTFERDKKSPKNSIYAIEKEKKGVHEGKFMFTVGMDLSYLLSLLGEEYLTNTDNYAYQINQQPSNDYSIEIENNTTNTGYTHNMKLTTDKISTSKLKIYLQNNFPQWVYDINDDEGLNIYKGDSINKTFGIKYLLEGMYDAYKAKKKTIHSIMDFNLRK